MNRVGSTRVARHDPGVFDMWLWLLEDENPAPVALFNSPATPNLVSKIDRLNKSQFWEPQNCRQFFAHRRLRKFLLEFWYPCGNLTLSQVRVRVVSLLCATALNICGIKGGFGRRLRIYEPVWRVVLDGTILQKFVHLHKHISAFRKSVRYSI
jgi:hypothetical protein